MLPPLVVVIAAEAITDVQHALTECVQRAHTTALQHAERTTPTDHHPTPPHSTDTVRTGLPPPRVVLGERSPLTSGEHPAEPCGERPAGGPGGRSVNGAGERVVGAGGERGIPHPVNPPARDPRRAPRAAGEHRRAARTARSGAHKGRTLLAEYVAEARSAWSPGVVITPAWVRGVTGCSRGLSSRVAAALNAERVTRVPDQTPPARTEPEGRTA
jgi:hypothetical protein